MVHVFLNVGHNTCHCTSKRVSWTQENPEKARKWLQDNLRTWLLGENKQDKDSSDCKKIINCIDELNTDLGIRF